MSTMTFPISITLVLGLLLPPAIAANDNWIDPYRQPASRIISAATANDEVWLDPVMVPHWVRGAESLEMVTPHGGSLAMLGLGNSIGTSGAPLEAEVLVVRSFADFEANSARARGRIVLFN